MHAVLSPQRFQIVRRLGEGGMGVVYEAIDRESDARVALKTLREFSPNALARFKREFRALQDIHHRNLVALGDLVCEEGQWFFSMELVGGTDFLPFVRLRVPSLSGEQLAARDALTHSRDGAATLAERRDATLPSGAFPALEAPSSSGRVDASFDERRLRHALRELSLGLVALHDAGKIHRDVKPSNIRVTPDERVVLLDFGLVGELDGLARGGGGGGGQVSNAGAAGTPGYMAPEQCSSKPIGPSADWYAVGAVLYEALTGKLPFEGSALEMMMHKQTRVPTTPSALVKGVPADLEDLCMALLAIDPAARPNGEAIARVLENRSASRQASLRAPRMPAEPTFVGREAELATLDDALSATRERRTVATLVYGESGVGKTWLASRFVERLGERREDTLVLRGRCHEREAVPYKALDDVVDALSRTLARVPAEVAQSLAPLWADSLLHVFPVLRRVRAFADRAEPDVAGAPHEIRRQAFAALRELLTRLALRQPTVIVIDDLQWADADSLALLAEVMRPPEAPHVLLVATFRAEIAHGAAPEIPAAVRDALKCEVRVMTVPPLSPGESLELARTLLGGSGAASLERATAIAEEAAGHPLYIEEIVRHSVASQDVRSFKLEDAVWARIERLSSHARALVELLSIAASPLTQETVATTMHGDTSSLATAIAQLRAAHLVRTTGSRASDRIEFYHDRLRAAVAAHVGDERRRELHAMLAHALEAGGGDADALSLHWGAAGDMSRAKHYAVIAGEQAAKIFAFDQAAQWYASALAMSDEAARDRALRIRYADALADGGRGSLAAAQYQLAARDATQAEALELRRRAAEQLLRCGHFDEGLATTAAVLRDVDMELPKTPMMALLLLVFYRMLLFFRGLRFRERDASEIAPKVLARIDTCTTVAVGLSLSDNVFGSLFNTRALLLALAAGEPRRIARTLSLEIPYNGTGGGRSWDHTEALMRRTMALAEKTGDAHAIAWVMSVSGVGHYLAGHVQRAFELCERAEQLLRNAGAGSAWEIFSTQLFATNSLFVLGRIKEHRRRVPLQLREAEQRGDVFATVNLRVGFSNMAWLVDDDVEGARKQVREAMQHWSKKGFHIEHFYELMALVNVELYAGNAEQAVKLIEERAHAYSRSLLGRVQLIRLRMWVLEARSALALAAKTGDERRLRDAERIARRIRREKMPWSNPHAQLVSATVCWLRGDATRAADLARDAAVGFEAADLMLDAVVSRWALGKMTKGARAEELVRGAEAWLGDQDVAKPHAILAMFAPGFGTRAML